MNTLIEHTDKGVCSGAEHEHEAVDGVVDQLFYEEAVSVDG